MQVIHCPPVDISALPACHPQYLHKRRVSGMSIERFARRTFSGPVAGIGYSHRRPKIASIGNAACKDGICEQRSPWADFQTSSLNASVLRSLHQSELCCSIREQQRSVTVLLAGTSGTGKSTLAGLLAARLGISTVLSTDSVRHMLRSFTPQAANPVLWASTYEVISLHCLTECASLPS